MGSAAVVVGVLARLTLFGRVVLLTGAFLLWPLVLYRWLRAGSAA